MASWWNKLSLDEQREYLTTHPNSELALQPRPFPSESFASIKGALGSGQLAQELDPAVQNAQQGVAQWDDSTKRGLGTLIRRAWTSDNAVRRRRVITQFALKAGLVLLTSAVLSGVAGIPASFYVPSLLSFNWNDLPDIRDPRDLCSAFGKLFFSGITLGLTSKHALARSLTSSRGRPSVAREQAVALRSTHESDLNKALVRLETAASSTLETNDVDAAVGQARVLQRTAWLEHNIPVIGNIVVASASGRSALGSRATRLLGAYTAELEHCYELATSLSTQLPNRSLRTILKHHMGTEPTCSTSVWRTDLSARACEYSWFEFDRTGSRVVVLGRRDADMVEIAYAVDSLFLPRQLYRMRARDLKAWLRANVETDHAN